MPVFLLSRQCRPDYAENGVELPINLQWQIRMGTFLPTRELLGSFAYSSPHCRYIAYSGWAMSAREVAIQLAGQITHLLGNDVATSLRWELTTVHNLDAAAIALAFFQESKKNVRHSDVLKAKMLKRLGCALRDCTVRYFVSELGRWDRDLFEVRLNGLVGEAWTKDAHLRSELLNSYWQNATLASVLAVRCKGRRKTRLRARPRKATLQYNVAMSPESDFAGRISDSSGPPPLIDSSSDPRTSQLSDDPSGSPTSDVDSIASTIDRPAKFFKLERDGIAMFIPTVMHDMHKPDFEIVSEDLPSLPSGHVQTGPRIRATPEHTTFGDKIYVQIPAHAGTTNVLRSTPQGTWESISWSWLDGCALVHVEDFCQFVPTHSPSDGCVNKVYVCAFWHRQKRLMRTMLRHTGQCKLCSAGSTSLLEELHQAGFEASAAGGADMSCVHGEQVSIEVNGVKRMDNIQVYFDQLPELLDVIVVPKDARDPSTLVVTVDLPMRQCNTKSIHFDSDTIEPIISTEKKTTRRGRGGAGGKAVETRQPQRVVSMASSNQEFWPDTDQDY